MQSKQNHKYSNTIKTNESLLEINGLRLFKKRLEKYFFAEVTIKLDTDIKNPNYHLIIDMKCNFGITESLFHLNSGNWGGFCQNSSKFEYSGFEFAVSNLQSKNNARIIIEEISIHFKDTSLFITKIPNQDISDQFCDILTAISENFVHFTKGLIEMPYEIFIPIFEETIVNKPLSAKSMLGSSYFDHWGLYFHSDINQDSSIYDLKCKSIINGDFFILDKSKIIRF